MCIVLLLHSQLGYKTNFDQHTDHYSGTGNFPELDKFLHRCYQQDTTLNWIFVSNQCSLDREHQWHHPQHNHQTHNGGIIDYCTESYFDKEH